MNAALEACCFPFFIALSTVGFLEIFVFYLKLWNYEIINNVLNEYLVFPSSYLNGNRPKSFLKKSFRKKVLIIRSKKVLQKKVLILKNLQNKKFYQFETLFSRTFFRFEGHLKIRVQSLSIVKNLMIFLHKNYES